MHPVRNEKGEVVAIDKKISDIKFVEKENGLITIHQEPSVRRNADNEIIAKRRYTIGGDTAGLGLDYYTAKVVADDTQETVATLRKQRIDEDKYADQVYCLGKYYHDALIGLETNYSYAPTKELVELDYPNLYQRKRYETTTREIQKVFGFETNRLTKPIILQSLVTTMRENVAAECDIATLKEMLTFVRKENGKQEAQEGYHDDLVMAKAIANYISIEEGDVNWIKVEPVHKPKSRLEKFFEENEEDEDDEVYVEW